MAVPYRLIIRYRITHNPPETMHPKETAHIYAYTAQLQVNDRIHCGYGATEDEAQSQLCTSLMSVSNGPNYIDLIRSLKA